MEKLGLTISNLNSRRFKKIQRKQLTNQIINDLYLQKKSDAQLKKWIKDLCPQISDDVDAHEKHFFECVRSISIRLSRLYKASRSRSSFYRLRNRIFEFPKVVDNKSSDESANQEEATKATVKEEIKVSDDDFDPTINPPVLSHIIVHTLDCPHCTQFRTIFEEDLKCHIIEHHPKMSRLLLIFSCPLCHAKSTDMRLMQEHKRMYHPNNITSVKSSVNHTEMPHQELEVDHIKRSSPIHNPVVPATTAKTNSSSSTGKSNKNLKRKFSSMTPAIVRPMNIPRDKQKSNKTLFSPPFTRRSTSNNRRSSCSTTDNKSSETKEKPRKESRQRSYSTSSSSVSTKKSKKSQINPDVYKRMKELYAMGTTEAGLLKNFLQIFVERDLIIESPVCKTDQRYFPTLNTIKSILSQNSSDFPPVGTVKPSNKTSNTTAVLKTLSHRRGVVNIGTVPQKITNKLSSNYKNSRRNLTKMQSKRYKLKGLNNKKTKSIKSQQKTPIITNVRSEQQQSSTTTLNHHHNEFSSNSNTTPSESTTNRDSGFNDHHPVLISVETLNKEANQNERIIENDKDEHHRDIEEASTSYEISTGHGNPKLDIDATSNIEQVDTNTLRKSPVNESSEEAMCKLCFGEFVDEEELRQHMQEIHPLGF